MGLPLKNPPPLPKQKPKKAPVDLMADLTANQRYEMIIDETNIAIELAKHPHHDDKEMIIDSYFLQACALYRLYKPLEAVASFNLGKRVRTRMRDQQEH